MENPLQKKLEKKMSETRKKMGIKPPSNKGKKWWNDGKGNNKISVECPGDGWVPGRRNKIS